MYWPGGARHRGGVSLVCCSRTEREKASVDTVRPLKWVCMSRYLLGKPRWSRLGHWAWYDSISLSLMIREVLSPGPETLVKD